LDGYYDNLIKGSCFKCSFICGTCYERADKCIKLSVSFFAMVGVSSVVFSGLIITILKLYKRAFKIRVKPS